MLAGKLSDPISSRAKLRLNQKGSPPLCSSFLVCTICNKNTTGNTSTRLVSQARPFYGMGLACEI